MNRARLGLRSTVFLNWSSENGSQPKVFADEGMGEYEGQPPPGGIEREIETIMGMRGEASI